MPGALGQTNSDVVGHLAGHAIRLAGYGIRFVNQRANAAPAPRRQHSRRRGEASHAEHRVRLKFPTNVSAFADGLRQTSTKADQPLRSAVANRRDRTYGAP